MPIKYKREEFTKLFDMSHLKVSAVLLDELDYVYTVDVVTSSRANAVVICRITHLTNDSVNFVSAYPVTSFLTMKESISVLLPKRGEYRPKSIQALLDDALAKEIYKIKNIS